MTDNLHFDREGHPITAEQWRLLFDDPAGRQLRRTRVGVRGVSTGDGLNVSFGEYEISTYWVGLRIRPDEPPIIFETAVKMVDGLTGWETRCRHSSKEDALEAHWKLVAELTAR